MRGCCLAGRAAAFFAATSFAPGAAAEECPPVEIRIAPSYEAPRGLEFAPKEYLRKKLGSPSGQRLLGVIETALGWDVEIGVWKRCLDTAWTFCVSRIEGRAGFEPGRMFVAAALEGDRCRTDAVVEHETRHLHVYDESTRLGVARIIDALAGWAGRQSPRAARPEAVEAGAKASRA